MANVQAKQLFQKAQNIFARSGSDERFLNDFIAGVNEAMHRINARSGESLGTVTNITSTEGEIELNDRYEYELLKGVIHWLVFMGHKSRVPGNNQAIDLRTAKAEWEEALDFYVTDQMRREYADSDEDDPLYPLMSNTVDDW